METIPKGSWPDGTIRLLSQGNTYISNECKRLDTSLFQTRLMFKKTLCMRGKDAAELFYDADRFSRHDAAPSRLKRTLIGKGGVQGLDGENHQDRKAMFMSLMSSSNIHRLVSIFERRWHEAALKWTEMETFSLYEEASEVCFEAACEWSGVQLDNVDVPKRTQQMMLMIESPAAIGTLHLRGILARKRAESWAAQLLREARESPLTSNSNQALFAFAHHKTATGEHLDEHSAAVDFLNVIRPIVAIGRYICFSAMALHQNPESRQKLKQGTDDDFSHFVQEVRRYYPYFPFVAATVKKDFEWRGYAFEKGVTVLLDLFGTNRDPQLWSNPDIFDPERFKDREEDAYNFIPQGGGTYKAGHRCAGEWITVETMKSAAKWLVQSASYTLPAQDLSVDLTSMPTLPASGLRVSNLKLHADKTGGRTTNNILSDNTIKHDEASSAAPAEASVCGEEDPGASLEMFVDDKKR